MHKDTLGPKFIDKAKEVRSRKLTYIIAKLLRLMEASANKGRDKDEYDILRDIVGFWSGFDDEDVKRSSVISSIKLLPHSLVVA